MDYYKVLGIPYGASKDEIKKAFRSLAKIHHPDKGGDANTFKSITEAYTALMQDKVIPKDGNPFKRYNEQQRERNSAAQQAAKEYQRSQIIAQINIHKRRLEILEGMLRRL